MNDFTYMSDRTFSKGRKYIGASDMPTLTGINSQYETPLEWWEVFTGKREAFAGNAKTEAGNLMEPVILGKYISETTKDTGRMRDFISSRMFGDNQFLNYHSWTECHAPENARFVSHADLLDMSGKIPVLVQAKNTGQIAAGIRRKNPYKGYADKDLTQNGIPLGVFFQEQWEMYCYGLPEAYVAVMIDGWDWRLYGPVKYNKKTVEKLVVLADRMLWHIDNNVPPLPKTWPDTVKLFPDIEKNTKVTITGQDEIDALEMVKQSAEIDEKMRVLEARKLDINMALAGLAGEPERRILHNYLCASDGSKIASFTDKSGRDFLSLSKLQELHPEAYEQYLSEGLITTSDSSRMIYISGSPAGTVDLWTIITYGENDKIQKSRKKYNRDEKEKAEALIKSLGVKADWEKYNF